MEAYVVRFYLKIFWGKSPCYCVLPLPIINEILHEILYNGGLCQEVAFQNLLRLSSIVLSFTSTSTQHQQNCSCKLPQMYTNVLYPYIYLCTACSIQCMGSFAAVTLVTILFTTLLNMSIIFIPWCHGETDCLHMPLSGLLILLVLCY